MCHSGCGCGGKCPHTTKLRRAITVAKRNKRVLPSSTLSDTTSPRLTKKKEEKIAC